jgi:hypothetical protein
MMSLGVPADQLDAFNEQVCSLLANPESVTIVDLRGPNEITQANDAITGE